MIDNLLGSFNNLFGSIAQSASNGKITLFGNEIYLDDLLLLALLYFLYKQQISEPTLYIILILLLLA